jgi:hypothetical protein
MIEYKWYFYESNSLIQEQIYSIKHDKKIGELIADRFTASEVRDLLQKKNKHYVYVVRQSTKAD